MKQPNHYRITIERTNTENESSQQTLQFEMQDREDMFAIVEKLKQGSGLDEQTSTRVGVALRLLGPAMMQDRKHPVFVDFFPHFKTFMQNVKSKLKNNS
ncbi:DUF3861 domain-containing protein [Photobacterium sp. DNB23_23_1]|uniref:DUF3861 domain-containing protein n=1 Tax=Photobacterium pectinilyticum TaxID=2906793 RepID=A0ABT1N2K5_9GAMM|nr:DUF3861 domain-containing protein [Photobacterium sp. ZSDE20]MCQ1058971.1 DUF3861 domain-containing protein [Photobacterium sp. ZSDE20]MDD1824014.1 DUF3861 domain-containing protein [Photobacterium sp. ZSDE20]